MENSSFHTSNDIRICDSEISIKAAFHRKPLTLKARFLSSFFLFLQIIVLFAYKR